MRRKLFHTHVMKKERKPRLNTKRRQNIIKEMRKNEGGNNRKLKTNKEEKEWKRRRASRG